MISFIISTYNRAQLLEGCIFSIFQQLSISDCEIIVVDNNSTDNTRQVCEKLMKVIPVLVYHFEAMSGISNARNSGAKLAKNQWLFFMDDDALAGTHMVDIAYDIIRTTDFECFGGPFRAWHFYPKPKWISNDFGSSAVHMNNRGELIKNHLTGGLFVIRKELFLNLNGFSADLGMKANKYSYGEEVDLQNKLRKLGYKIGYDPALYIDHLVKKENYSVYTLLVKNFRIGQVHDSVVDLNEVTFRFTDGVYLVYSSIFRSLINCIALFPNLFEKGYYIQNYLLDSFGNIFFSFGRVSAYLKSRNKIKWI